MDRQDDRKTDQLLLPPPAPQPHSEAPVRPLGREAANGYLIGQIASLPPEAGRVDTTS